MNLTEIAYRRLRFLLSLPERSLRALAALVGTGRARELVIRKVDGLPVGESPFRDQLRDAGFSAGYRGLTLRGAR